MSAESRQTALKMFRNPVEKFAGQEWTRARGADLRKFCREIVERHIERKLVTTVQLEKL
jgi:hypothetical protein